MIIGDYISVVEVFTMSWGKPQGQGDPLPLFFFAPSDTVDLAIEKLLPRLFLNRELLLVWRGQALVLGHEAMLPVPSDMSVRQVCFCSQPISFVSRSECSVGEEV